MKKGALVYLGVSRDSVSDSQPENFISKKTNKHKREEARITTSNPKNGNYSEKQQKSTLANQSRRGFLGLEITQTN